MTDGDVEVMWDHPLTARQTGVWCVDLIEEISKDPGGELSERARALIVRLHSLGEHDVTFLLMAQAAVLVSRELQFYIDTHEMIPVNVAGEEKYQRALLHARSVYRDSKARSPYQPSDEG